VNFIYFLGYVGISWLIWSVDILDELKFPSVHDRSIDIFGSQIVSCDDLLVYVVKYG